MENRATAIAAAFGVHCAPHVLRIDPTTFDTLFRLAAGGASAAQLRVAAGDATVRDGFRHGGTRVADIAVGDLLVFAANVRNELGAIDRDLANLQQRRATLARILAGE